MLATVLRRLALLPLTLVGIATLTFALLHVVPGDPIDVLLGESAAPAAREELRSALGLDRPLAERYASWMTGALRGDLGASIRSRRPVAEMVVERLPATALLGVVASSIAILVGIPLGVLAAAFAGRGADRVALAWSLAAVATPSFWLGPMLVLVFAVGLGLLPVAGSATPAHLVLPALTLGFGMSGILVRMTRATVLETLADDYVRTARAKGASEARVLFRHALPNAVVPLLAIVGLQLGAVLGGSVVTETIFAWPGLGRLVVEAVQARDFPVVQGAVLMLATTTVLVHLAVDLLQMVADPRSRDAGAR